MMSKSTDLNLYRVLYTIYTAGNLTRAGEILGVSQPAVSNSLARLRKLYDEPLFIRSGTYMRPTYKTEQIIDKVSTALDMLTNTLESKPPHIKHRVSS